MLDKRLTKFGDWLGEPSSKTEKGVRRVLMPNFYADKMQAYIESLQLNENDRIFLLTKSYLHHTIRRGYRLSCWAREH